MLAMKYVDEFPSVTYSVESSPSNSIALQFEQSQSTTDSSTLVNLSETSLRQNPQRIENLPKGFRFERGRCHVLNYVML